MNETLKVMLKTTIFFLFGCSLYFGQSLPTTGSTSSNQNNNCNCTANLNTMGGDGTRASNSDGGSGSQPDSGTGSQQQQARSDLNVDLNQGNLRVFFNQQDRKFNRYVIYDISGNLKKEQIISSTNSYTIDISNLSSGNYLIVVAEYPSNTGISRLFVKP